MNTELAKYLKKKFQKPTAIINNLQFRIYLTI